MFSDAVFLQNHPGWSWRDLEEAPVELVDAMHALDHAQIQVAKARRNSGPLRE